MDELLVAHVNLLARKFTYTQYVGKAVEDVTPNILGNGCTGKHLFRMRMKNSRREYSLPVRSISFMRHTLA
jgi:hypothetical protein